MLDMASYTNVTQHMNTFRLSKARRGDPLPPSVVRRLTIDLVHKTTLVSTIPNSDLELPVISPAVRGRPYRYVYAHSKNPTTSWWNKIIKLDVETGEAIERGTSDTRPSEPVFVPRPGATREDDGILMSIVLLNQESSLNLWNATDMSEVATIQLPIPIPYQSHGMWVDSEVWNRADTEETRTHCRLR